MSDDGTLDKAQGIFLFLNYVELDLKKLLEFNLSENFTEELIVIQIYNILCSINFLH